MFDHKRLFVVHDTGNADRFLVVSKPRYETSSAGGVELFMHDVLQGRTWTCELIQHEVVEDVVVNERTHRIFVLCENHLLSGSYRCEGKKIMVTNLRKELRFVNFLPRNIEASPNGRYVAISGLQIARIVPDKVRQSVPPKQSVVVYSCGDPHDT